MAASGVSAVNEVSEETAFDLSEFMRYKVSEMQSISDTRECKKYVRSKFPIFDPLPPYLSQFVLHVHPPPPIPP